MAHSSLRNHRKLIRFCRILKIEKTLAIGHLVQFWWSIDEGTKVEPEGALAGWSSDDISASMEWAGDADELVAAMVEVGFLDERSLVTSRVTGCECYAYRVHDYADWAPNYVRQHWRRNGWAGPKTEVCATSCNNVQQSGTLRNKVDKRNETKQKETKGKEEKELASARKKKNAASKLAESAPHSPDVRKKAEINLDAEAVYQAYPKHIGHGRAVTAIRKALRAEPFDSLLEAVKRYAESVGHAKGTQDWQYVPHPATWFNGERWKDEADPKARVNPLLEQLNEEEREKSDA